nr:stage II sporulation protein P [Thalassobacillus sp. CUG 92003]
MQLATNIKLGDFRTLLGREIPGLGTYHSEIIVAGEGTNITTIPIESPPPTDDQLENQTVEQDEIDKAKEEKPLKDTKNVSEKSVYIYHTHSWEAFEPLLKGSNNSPHTSSTNPSVNVIAVGKKLKNELESRGIGVKHNQSNVREGMNAKGMEPYESYVYSRGLVKEALAQNENMSYLIDIHRDSQPAEITTKKIDGKNYARIFFVVGKAHKNYEKSLEIANELHHELEKKYPGISRGIYVKTKAEGNGIYNQDLSDRALLLEFGGVDNNLTELYNSVEAFAEVFDGYYRSDAKKVNTN